MLPHLAGRVGEPHVLLHQGVGDLGRDGDRADQAVDGVAVGVDGPAGQGIGNSVRVLASLMQIASQAAVLANRGA